MTPQTEQQLLDEFLMMRADDIVFAEQYADTEIDFKQWIQDHDLNCCDKCKLYEHTNDLIWITADDFTPKAGEIVPMELCYKYDALCEDCYLKLINE